MSTREITSIWLLAFQIVMTGAVGALAILAPTSLLLRVVWWACASLGVLVIISGVANYALSRKLSWLFIPAFSLLGLLAITPAERWLIGL